MPVISDLGCVWIPLILLKTENTILEFVFEVIQNCLEPIPNSFCILVVVDFSNLIKRISYNLCCVISKMLILVRGRFLCL